MLLLVILTSILLHLGSFSHEKSRFCLPTKGAFFNDVTSLFNDRRTCPPLQEAWCGGDRKMRNRIRRGDSRIARRRHHRQRTAPKPPLCKGRENRPLRCRTRCDSSRRGRVTRPLYAPSTSTAPSPPFEGGQSAGGFRAGSAYFAVGTPVLGRPNPADYDGICDITVVPPFGLCLHRTPRERRPYGF